jgi:pimeloyl-ACP methyl ester carboxylesterase
VNDSARSKPLYKSSEARAKFLAHYEEVLGRWREITGLELERITLDLPGGTTTAFAFGPSTPAEDAMKPLVLLHGTLSNSCMWLADAATLGARRRVFAIDIPGEPGLSAETYVDWQGSGYADWLGQTIDALGLGEHDLVGFSIGGWIALSYAIRKPRNLRSLALLCPSGIGRAKASFIFKAMLQMPRGERGIEKIARSLYGDMEPPEGAIRAGTDFSMATNARMESPRIFTDEELAEIEARLFLAVGEKDVMLHSRESARRLGRIRSEAEIRLLPGAGHALISQSKLVLDFLDRPRQA